MPNYCSMERLRRPACRKPCRAALRFSSDVFCMASAQHMMWLPALTPAAQYLLTKFQRRGLTYLQQLRPDKPLLHSGFQWRVHKSQFGAPNETSLIGFSLFSSTEALP